VLQNEVVWQLWFKWQNCGAEFLSDMEELRSCNFISLDLITFND